MKISVEVRNMDKVQNVLNTIQKGLREKAIGPALNRAAEKARAELARAIPEEYAVRAAEVRNAVSLRKARSGNLEATITVFGSTSRRGRSMNLIHFLAAVQQAGKAMKTRGAKASKADLSALNRQLGFLIKRGGGLRKIDGAFVGNQGRTIFRRTGKARLPIEPLQVIGFSQMFSSQKISTRIMTKIDADLLIEINRSIARLMGNRST